MEPSSLICALLVLGTYETYGLGERGSAFELKPDTGPPLAEVRV
jgi:hypothetical protein